MVADKPLPSRGLTRTTKERATVRTGIYAIYDRQARAVVGGLQMHRHDAAAIRTFGDVASQKGSMVQMHPEDYDLIRLGHLDDDAEPAVIQAHQVPEVVITGAAWLHAQKSWEALQENEQPERHH